MPEKGDIQDRSEQLSEVNVRCCKNACVAKVLNYLRAIIYHDGKMRIRQRSLLPSSGCGFFISWNPTVTHTILPFHIGLQGVLDVAVLSAV